MATTQGYWWHVSSRASVTSGAWNHEPPPVKVQDRGCGSAFSLPSLTGGGVHCDLQTQTKQHKHNTNKHKINFILFFKSQVFFSRLLLLQGEAGLPMVGAAIGRRLLALRCCHGREELLWLICWEGLCCREEAMLPWKRLSTLACRNGEGE